MRPANDQKKKDALYWQQRAEEFHDSCGVGFLASISGIASHQNVQDTVTALERLAHRGAITADGKGGDGSGFLFSMPTSFMRKTALELGHTLPELFAVAVLFITDEQQKHIFETYCDGNDLKVLFYRDVPTNNDVLGAFALQTQPTIIQAFVGPNSLMASQRFEALLYLTRKEVEHALADDSSLYIASFSHRAIAYKGLVMPTYIRTFFPDLSDPEFAVSYGMFHQRFSTNTLPSWKLAQPFRFIAHNGEINSISTNRSQVAIKSLTAKSQFFSDQELARIFPLLEEKVSDSASLDNYLEFLLLNGVDFFKAIRSLVQAPWQNAPHIDANLRAFYEYTSTFAEGWDGPAAISLTDGRYIACVMDRNGLRPAKYTITRDNRLIVASEYGVLDIPEDDIVERGRLCSGEMIALDMKYQKILKDDEINMYLSSAAPYSTWLNENMVYLQEVVNNPYPIIDIYSGNDLYSRQRYFNLTQEVLEQFIDPMLFEGKEGVSSMGDDTPIAAFSDVQRSFFDFFRQRFSQVTNPPIDPLREDIVMSLSMYIGALHNVLDETPEHAQKLTTISPIVTRSEMEWLLDYGDQRKACYRECFKHQTFSTVFTEGLKKSLDALANNVVTAVKNTNVRIVILDDRDFSATNKIIPIAMAVGRVNQALRDAGLRHQATIIAVTGEVFIPHSAAILFAYGASALYPYLLFATAHKRLNSKNFSDYQKKQHFKQCRNTLNLGILKIMSKMGISTLPSYHNSALFSVLGLANDIMQDCFRQSTAHLPGLSYEMIEKRLTTYHQEAFAHTAHASEYALNVGGQFKYIPTNSSKEYHDYSPHILSALHTMVLSGATEDYQKFDSLLKQRGTKMIRDFLTISSDRPVIALSDVEEKTSLFKRFESSAMSVGAISPEAHNLIAEAMNKLGGASNCGEGGEDASRYRTSKNSAVKQISSGRFGVTPAYLRFAQEIQIKVAQGAKPGEGGQLPGHKVTPLIASIRHTTPGVTLISPPPHHDIYSIEDLSQLIWDLKQFNPDARISIKLVSTSGVGTIAVGAAKTHADKIVISGCEGGTGASPLASIKYAGNPWELGLVEAHNALKVNGLREYVTLQTDGGLKNGLDVVKAALLGSETFGFGTVVLACIGCKMLRVCHQNRCVKGIATQDESLRANFEGSLQNIINYFTLLADDIRSILASMGYTSLQEIIGRSDLLKTIDTPLAKQFDFHEVLAYTDKGINTCQKDKNNHYEQNTFEQEVLREVRSTIENPEQPITSTRTISSKQRSFGAHISGEIAKYYDNTGLPDDAITLHLKGISGLSLGAFMSRGMTIRLDGVANDYVGKGMHGGKIIIVPEKIGPQFSAAGNTCLYGATGGILYVAGSVGERFAVRNSGALAITEGTGDHACEYMTGGVVVVLGKTGINFGAGMTGGLAFVYDHDHVFVDKMNRELVTAIRIDTDTTDEHRFYLKRLITAYYRETFSPTAKGILDHFRDEIRHFWMVQPKDMINLPLNPEKGD